MSFEEYKKKDQDERKRFKELLHRNLMRLRAEKDTNKPKDNENNNNNNKKKKNKDSDQSMLLQHLGHDMGIVVINKEEINTEEEVVRKYDLKLYFEC